MQSSNHYQPHSQERRGQDFQPRNYYRQEQQDHVTSHFKGDVKLFLREARSWFPRQLPQTLENASRSKNWLRLMCYNLLADSLVSHMDYGALNKDFLAWEKRFPQICKEIECIKPQILCLQETEEQSGIHEYLLQNGGMEGAFMKKKQDDKLDGCATYYDPTRFGLVGKFEIPFNYYSKSQLYQKPNLSLILVLKPLDSPDKIFIVANTHILFNDRRGDIKMAQLKLMTEAIGQLKNYYQKQERQEVIIFVCGDFNSSSRSGVYEFMRLGYFDCMKMGRADISGQFYGQYKMADKLIASIFDRSIQNLDVLPSMSKDIGQTADWYVELMNSYLVLDFENGKPEKFSFKTMLPFERICMGRDKFTKSAEAGLYLDQVHNYIRASNLTDFNSDPLSRQFFILKNQAGYFKSAYAQNLTNHVIAINYVKNQSKFPVEFLDIYSKELEKFVVELLCAERNNIDQLYPPDYQNEIYGAHKWMKSNTHVGEWLKKYACVTKEPSYTAFTNNKMCVDYIFYQGGSINVARVLDLPSYHKYMKDNIQTLPHPVMPSDHLSIVADFYIQ